MVSIFIIQWNKAKYILGFAMSFHCFVCYETFTDLSNTFSHLKKTHFLRDNGEDLKCIANTKCSKIFDTFSGLRRHAKKCNFVCNNEVRRENIYYYNDEQKKLI